MLDFLNLLLLGDLTFLVILTFMLPAPSTDVSLAEVMAIRFGRILACSLTKGAIICGSDSLVAVKALSSLENSNCPWILANVLGDCHLLSSFLEHVEFRWIPRNSDVAAHNVAQMV